jgi:hypothetical protein
VIPGLQRKAGMQEADQNNGNIVLRFFSSPLRSKYPPPMTHIGDYFAVAGLVLFCISVFGLDWMAVGVKDLLGIGKTLGIKGPRVGYGLFVSPWAWGMVAVLVITVAGVWFVQTRGGITLGAGIYCLVFNVVFFIGAWHKINAIIGDIAKVARNVPFIGQMLGEAVNTLFIPAGLLLVTGGALRLASRPRTISPAVESQ